MWSAPWRGSPLRSRAADTFDRWRGRTPPGHAPLTDAAPTRAGRARVAGAGRLPCLQARPRAGERLLGADDPHRPSAGARESAARDGDPRHQARRLPSRQADAGRAGGHAPQAAGGLGEDRGPSRGRVDNTDPSFVLPFDAFVQLPQPVVSDRNQAAHITPAPRERYGKLFGEVCRAGPSPWAYSTRCCWPERWAAHCRSSARGW